jgi:hypothetical protein
MTTQPTVNLTQAFSIPTSQPVALPLMLADTVDTRGVDLYPLLGPPVNDTVVSVTSATVTRQDGLPINSSDLVVTPLDTLAPWIAPNLAGVPAVAVAWWQGVGAVATVAQPNGVTYLLEIAYVTAAGRSLGVTLAQTVSASAG